ncbi:MAG TPA: integrase arm-type DNA-binding domain-containing protein [Methylocella sp.]|nr:integrase arm-type DNA-binding domain-containing protein [Methylocella sp.]
MAGKEKLSARAAATAKPGRYCDGRGLWLVVSQSGARKWVFRFTFGGRVTEMGLGSAAVSLAAARDKAHEARKLIAAGINPIHARREAGKIAAGKPTFGQCAEALLEAKSSEWRNEKHRAQWRMTLMEYAKPLRDMLVDQVDTEAVLSVLQPIWQAKPETASRLRGRIETVLDAARAKGHIARNEANPARWRGHLDKLLPKRQKLSRGHHAAMAFDEVPRLVGKLRQREAIAALALEFAILTAARSGEVLGARWCEIDLEAKVWTIPAVRMKAGREHRVPLSDRAVRIIKKLAEGQTGEFVFPGQRSEKPLSGMAMEMVLRRMKVEGVTVHGFRSAFRDWCGEATSFPREIAEAALAHAAGDATERAYRRGDALEKRRKLMEAWAGFCEPKGESNVVPMAKAK